MSANIGCRRSIIDHLVASADDQGGLVAGLGAPAPKQVKPQSPWSFGSSLDVWGSTDAQPAALDIPAAKVQLPVAPKTGPGWD